MAEFNNSVMITVKHEPINNIRCVSVVPSQKPPGIMKAANHTSCLKAVSLFHAVFKPDTEYLVALIRRVILISLFKSLRFCS